MPLKQDFELDFNWPISRRFVIDLYPSADRQSYQLIFDSHSHAIFDRSYSSVFVFDQITTESDSHMDYLI